MKAQTFVVLLAGVLAVNPLASAVDASAAPRKTHHHRRHVAVVPSRPAYARAPVAEARSPDSFYPETIEGGVRGNLPFNNQLRKLSDPLNANGAGR